MNSNNASEWSTLREIVKLWVKTWCVSIDNDQYQMLVKDISDWISPTITCKKEMEKALTSRSPFMRLDRLNRCFFCNKEHHPDYEDPELVKKFGMDLHYHDCPYAKAIDAIDKMKLHGRKHA